MFPSFGLKMHCSMPLARIFVGVWVGAVELFFGSPHRYLLATLSSVKVPDLNTGATKAVINTGGNGRTDEGATILSPMWVVDSRGPFGTVVIVDTDLNVVTKELIPDPPFAGACSFPARNTVTGPNGVFVIKSGANAEVWAGDGPVLTAAGIAHAGMG
jgi:hypothetical protein